MTWTERNTGLISDVFEWWLTSTVVTGDVVAVYQPLGAINQAASYTNWHNPGTNDAAPGTAPTWARDTGWQFNGSTQYLTTGITPTSVYTIMVRYRAIGNIAGSLIGQEALNADFYMELSIFGPPLAVRHTPHWAADLRNSQDTYQNQQSVVFSQASNLGYYIKADGTTQLFTPMAGPFSGTPIPMFIGAHNQATNDVNHYNSTIQAIAIYDRQLTEDEVIEVSGQMQLIESTDNPDNLPNVNYIVINPATRRLNNRSHELWLAADEGIYHTFNGGRGWTKISLPAPSNDEFGDIPAATVDELSFNWIDYDPTDNTILYAYGSKASVNRVWVYKAVNSGVNESDWTSRGVVVSS